VGYPVKGTDPHERLVVGVQQALERALRRLALAKVVPCDSSQCSPRAV
jgi:hypothetical protein